MREREKIRLEEAALLRDQASLHASERELQALLRQDERWKKQEHMLVQAESARRQLYVCVCVCVGGRGWVELQA